MFPTFNPLPADRFSRSNRTLFQLTLFLVLSAFVLGSLGAWSTQAALAPPSLTGKIIAGTSDLLSIEGGGFTPGGRVQVFVTDLDGNSLHEPVWTMAAPGAPFGDYGQYSGVSGYGDPGTINVVLDLGDTTIYGPNGSQDPANGYDDGSHLGALKSASSIQVRAFDEYSTSWTTFAAVDTTTALEFSPGYSFRYDLPQRCTAFIPCGLPF